MSAIPPTNPLASSLSQGALQQSEASKTQDQKRGEAARFSQKMKEALARHLETVEDSYEATEDHLQVDPDERNPQRDPRDAQDESESESESDARPDASGGLDVEA